MKHYRCLDSNALEVAKLNLWLEAIKLAPKEFQSNKLPSESRHLSENINNYGCRKFF